jgi:hypothetical protein
MQDTEIAQTLGRIEATLTSVRERMVQQDGVDASLHECLKSLDARVSKLENTNLRVGSVVGTVLFCMGLLGGATLSGIAQLGNIFK